MNSKLISSLLISVIALQNCYALDLTKKIEGVANKVQQYGEIMKVFIFEVQFSTKL
jgi:hypothetical protein